MHNFSFDPDQSWNPPDRQPIGRNGDRHGYDFHPHPEYPNPGNGNGPRSVPKAMSKSTRRLLRKLGLASKRQRFPWDNESRLNFPGNRFVSQPGKKDAQPEPSKRKVGRPRKKA